MVKKISPERKAAYYAGMGVTALGGCLFAAPFLTIPMIMIGALSFRAGPVAFLFAAIGFGCFILGGFLMNIGKVGLAGAGVILDPERAREEQEPLTRMRGGMVRDGLEEAGILDENGLKIGRSPAPEPIIMIHCRECGKLNEEDSKFCQECGSKM